MDKDKRVLITGASTGLGKELAIQFAAEKRNLVLVGRVQEKLLALKDFLESKENISCHIIALDLSKEGAARELKSQTDKAFFTIELLINNAGFGYWGGFFQQAEDNIKEMLYLQVLNISLITHYYGKEMSSQNRGRIIQIASTAAYQAGPFMATYFASKSYLLLLTEAIQLEHQAYPIMQIVCPGAFKSDFENKAQMSDVIFFKISGIPSAKEMAEKIMKFSKTNRRVLVPGLMNKIILVLQRFSPRRLNHYIISKFLSKK